MREQICCQYFSVVTLNNFFSKIQEIVLKSLCWITNYFLKFKTKILTKTQTSARRWKFQRKTLLATRIYSHYMLHISQLCTTLGFAFSFVSTLEHSSSYYHLTIFFFAEKKKFLIAYNKVHFQYFAPEKKNVKCNWKWF